MALSEQRKEYLYEYQKTKLKRIPLDVTKEKYEQIASAAAQNEKVNGYIKKAIDERMERDSQKLRKPFTKETAEQIDTGKLLNDFRYQLDIGLAYGNNVLTRLLNEAMQQSAD